MYRNRQLEFFREELAKTVPLETADKIISSIDASSITVVSDEIHSIASTQPVVVNNVESVSAAGGGPQLTALDLLLFNTLFSLA